MKILSGFSLRMQQLKKRTVSLHFLLPKSMQLLQMSCTSLEMTVCCLGEVLLLLLFFFKAMNAYMVYHDFLIPSPNSGSTIYQLLLPSFVVAVRSFVFSHDRKFAFFAMGNEVI